MRRLPLLIALSIALAAPTAGAQAPASYKKGVKLENSGDLLGALAEFESIPEAKRDFNTRLHIAGCKKKLGRLLEAEKDYEAIRTDPKADPATVDTAASDLEDLRPRIPKLIVKLSPATTDVAVTVNEQETATPATLSFNPGTYTVIATRGDAQVFKREVNLTESTTIEVEIDAPKAAPPPAVVDAPKPAPVAEEKPSTQRTFAYVSLAAGGAFAAAAVGAWFYSGSRADDYLANCRAGRCDESEKSSVRRWETISFVAAGAAIVGVGVGVTLLLTSPKERPVAVTAGTNGVFIVGRF